MEHCVLKATALLVLLAASDATLMAQSLSQRLKSESIETLAKAA